MRTIINISVPEQLNKEVEEAVKEGNYGSKSEFFRDAFRAWKRQKLLDTLEQTRKEIASGKAKAYRSAKEMHDDILKNGN